ncbi:tRNA (adenine-N(6)-)-methyltransferase [Bacteroides sp. 224]|nr:tRNA (adenine-N(6)-)-methyltransferase [Bacteroides sp. 224]
MSVNDEKFTPQYAVLPILKYLPKDKIVWCPFDTKNSEFVIALQENGFEIVFSHITTGEDFFEYEPEKWDIIVSNPPFSNKKGVFERCLNFGKPFALLMSNLWLSDISPSKLFKNKELQLLLFNKRIQYDEKNRIPFGSSYFCHKLLPKQIIFEELEVIKGQYSRMYQDFK